MGKPGRIQVAWSLKLGLRSYGARINAIPGRKWLAMPGVIQVICRVYTSEQFLTDRCLAGNVMPLYCLVDGVPTMHHRSS
jgi:hypothetical protein